MKYRLYRNIIFSLAIGYIVSSGISIMYQRLNPFMKETAGHLTLLSVGGWTLFFAAAFAVIFHIKKEIRREFLLYAGMFFGLSIIIARGYNAKLYFALVVIVLLCILAFAFKEIWKDSDDFFLFRGKNVYVSIAVMSAIGAFVVAWGTILRYRGYNSSTFDLGIFTQMFESMATDFTQNTTLERNVLLSHFAVHFSPIYYVLLPIYMIFRSPECLLACQSAIVFSGVIPLVLICRYWRYSNKVTFFISGIFLTFVPFTGGCFYDFHENLFLVPLLLWLFYFLEKNQLVGIVCFALLLLLVKEDAGLYVIIIGVYALFNKKVTRLNSVLLLMLGISGFLFATMFIRAFGEGIKVSRYGMFLNAGEDSLVNVIINVVKNPAYMLSELITEEKVIFILEMLVPLLFFPFRTRKYCDWILIFPFLLVNLATSYSYQFDVQYQYAFASGVCLLFLFAKNIRYSKRKAKTAALAFMSSTLILFSVMYGRYVYYSGDFYEEAEAIAQTDEVIDTLDKNASVLSTTYLTPQLYDFKEVYMIPKADFAPEILILDNRRGRYSDYEKTVTEYTSNGYVIYADKGFATILVSPEYAAAHSIS